MSRTRYAIAVVVALTLVAVPQARAAEQYSNPVIASDFPDPSVVRAGGDYWATATSGDWSPTFPLEHSTDLVNWTAAGAIFDRPPAWTDGAYWAPALQVRDGRFLAYYAARRRGSKPCIGVATAPTGRGPYLDHGPILCPRSGAIDPQPLALSATRQVLLYKQMGVHAPVRMVTLSSDGLRVGRRDVALLAPTQSWEGGVTENPFLVARPDGYYLFYSGGHCCRPPCTYATGVARSTKLLGPYVKAPAPVLRGDATWMCPGGASVVSDPAGQDDVLYHAYARGDPSLGREALLDTLTWGPDGWPVVAAGAGPSAVATSALATAPQRPPAGFADAFDERELLPGWQWPVGRRPDTTLHGTLTLHLVPGDDTATFLGRIAPLTAYVATTELERPRRPGVRASLALLRAGDGRTIGIAASTRGLEVWRREGERTTILARSQPPPSAHVWLRLAVPGDGTVTPQASTDATTWTTLAPPIALATGFDAARLVLGGSGPRSSVATFDDLRIDPYDG